MKKSQTASISAKKLQYLFAEIGRSITGSLEKSEIIRAIMHQVDLFYRPDNWSLFLVDAENQDLVFAIAKGLDLKKIKNIRLKAGEGIAGCAAMTGKTLLVSDVEKNPRFAQKIDEISGFKTKSIIAVPIVYRNTVLGVIELVNSLKHRKLTKHEVKILEIIADFSAIALANAFAYEKMSYLAVHDPLTGLFNRKKFDEVIGRFQNLHPGPKKRNAENQEVVIAWIDIDHFEQVNDQYGHAVGDSVLVAAARLLQDCCRPDDLAFRVGGDEFLLMLMNVDKNGLPAVRARLQENLEACSKQILPAPGFSFGIATGLKSDLDQIISHADNLMYQNKDKKKEKISYL